MTEAAKAATGKRIAGQGAMLFSGFALAQGFSFARNAIVAHWLSKGDFGVASAILLLLQLLETLSDLGADRLIVQAKDGSDPRVVATAQLTLVLRGLVTALLLVALAVPMASFFDIRDAAWAFAAAATVPFIKGFLSLDSRVAQRTLNNRPQITIEVLPQAIALALTIPMLKLFGDYTAVLWLAIVQAITAMAVSHIIARQRYALACDMHHVRRLIAFGWPIWASAFPLIAVYQGDRMLIAHLVGIEALAAYTAAFMITMVPGLIAAKVANALMLPLLSIAQDDAERFAARFRMMAEATTLVAALYLVTFVIAGGTILPIAFGHNYAGLSNLVGWLALMWSMRMLQAVPGAVLLAKGITRPFFTAGLIRATGLLLAWAALLAGWGMEGAAAAGAIAEFASLAFITWLLNRIDAPQARTERYGLGSALAIRGLLMIPAGALALAVNVTAGSTVTLLSATLFLAAVSLAVIALAALTMPDGKRQLLAMCTTQAH